MLRPMKSNDQAQFWCPTWRTSKRALGAIWAGSAFGATRRSRQPAVRNSSASTAPQAAVISPRSVWRAAYVGQQPEFPKVAAIPPARRSRSPIRLILADQHLRARLNSRASRLFAE
jgi:hypothetical protein